MNKKTILAVGVIILVVITAAIVAVALVSRLRTSDFSGTYRLTGGGKDAEAVMHIDLEHDSYTVVISGVKDFRATYNVKKKLGNTLVIKDNSGGNKTVEYELRKTNRGFEGKVWVLPMGEFDVLFEKIAD